MVVFSASFIGVLVSVPLLLLQQRRRGESAGRRSSARRECTPRPRADGCAGRARRRRAGGVYPPGRGAVRPVPGPVGPCLSAGRPADSGTGSSVGWAGNLDVRSQLTRAAGRSRSRRRPPAARRCRRRGRADVRFSRRPGRGDARGLAAAVGDVCRPFPHQAGLPALVQQMGHPLDVLLGHQQLHAGRATAAALPATGAALQVGGNVRRRQGGLQFPGIGQRRSEAGHQLALDIHVLFHVPNVTRAARRGCRRSGKVWRGRYAGRSRPLAGPPGNPENARPARSRRPARLSLWAGPCANIVLGTLRGSRTPREGLRAAKPRYAHATFVFNSWSP